MPQLPEAEPRLQSRYRRLVAAHLRSSQLLAAGVHPPPGVAGQFAAVQGMWRFLANPRVTMPKLAAPLAECFREGVRDCCRRYVLVAVDWCKIHLNGRRTAEDRVALAHKQDLGYELLTTLAISDTDGRPIAPVGLELRASDGLHTTRSDQVQPPVSKLDGLDAMMTEVEAAGPAKPPVFVIDAEGDSVGHYRQWAAKGRLLLVRADGNRKVMYNGRERELGKIADSLHRKGRLRAGQWVDYHGKQARVWVGEAAVVLHRPARRHRVGPDGKRRHKNVPGPLLPMRLVVAELRDGRNRVLARWLLLTNLPASVTPKQVAAFYGHRWGIESFHKLFKRAGLFLEQWQQKSAGAMAKRLAVAAMSAVLVWRLARDKSPEAEQMRDLLVRLSGRQIKRGKNRPTFTTPALLAGLDVLVPALMMLTRFTPKELSALARCVLPILDDPPDSG